MISCVDIQVVFWVMDIGTQSCIGTYTNQKLCESLSYGVATMSRLLKIIGFFCKRDL